MRPSAIPCAIALATISTSAGESWSRSFHERAIWRACTRSRSEIGGRFRHSLLHNRNVPEFTSPAAIQLCVSISEFVVLLTQTHGDDDVSAKTQKATSAG